MYSHLSVSTGVKLHMEVEPWILWQRDLWWLCLRMLDTHIALREEQPPCLNAGIPYFKANAIQEDICQVLTSSLFIDSRPFTRFKSPCGLTGKSCLCSEMKKLLAESEDGSRGCHVPLIAESIWFILSHYFLETSGDIQFISGLLWGLASGVFVKSLNPESQESSPMSKLSHLCLYFVSSPATAHGFPSLANNSLPPKRVRNWISSMGPCWSLNLGIGLESVEEGGELSSKS